MRNSVFYLLILVAFSSCQNGKEEKSGTAYNSPAEVPARIADSTRMLDIYTVKNLYRIEVPMRLHRSDEMQAYQSLRLMDAQQIQNINVFDVSKAEFHQLIKENKKEAELSMDLSGYLESVTSNFVQNGFNLSAPVDTVVAGNKVRWVETEGKYGDKEVYFLIAAIEGASNYYQVSCWTPLDQKQSNRRKFLDVVTSFREVK